MRPWFTILLLSCFCVSVYSICCGTTYIGYRTKDRAICGVIPGGDNKTSVDNDNVVGDILSKLDRRRPKCVIGICNDGLAHNTTYCGRGPCNIFGCDCDGGCWGDQQDAYTRFKERYENYVSYSRVYSWADTYLP